MANPPAGNASSFEARRLEPGVDARWDAFVRESPQANPFAMSGWLHAAAESAHVSLDRWAVVKGEEWVAVLAVPHRPLLGRTVYRGLPLAAYSTMLQRASSASESDRLESTRRLAETLKRHYRLTSLLLSPTLDDVRAWQWEGWSATPRYTCVLDLVSPAKPADSVRRHVRKCVEAGTKFETTWDLETFWVIFDETRERQGFGASLDRATFFALATKLGNAGLAWMATARTASGEPMSSQIVLSIPGTPTAFMWVAGTRGAHLSSGVSAWLMLEIAAEAARRGHHTWDLCGADYPSIARFKRELGAALQHYFQIDQPRSPIERLALGLKRRHA